MELAALNDKIVFHMTFPYEHKRTLNLVTPESVAEVNSMILNDDVSFELIKEQHKKA